MHELAASLHAYLLTQDAPVSLTASLRLRLSLLKHYTEKVAMQLVLLQSCCLRHTAIALWLHQQACAYLDAVMELTGETLRELARFVTQARRDQQEASVEGADGIIDLLVQRSKSLMTVSVPHKDQRSIHEKG